ncbi:MAG: hypothetical protein NTZ64_15130 [Polaromonas sp.]|nr:hypothetical protein [Polaromonas sp.]
MPVDLLSGYSDAPTAPARRLLDVTPADGVDLPFVSKWLFVGGAGTISLLAAGDTVPVTLSVGAGTLLPVRAAQVLATGTTASAIVSGY